MALIRDVAIDAHTMPIVELAKPELFAALDLPSIILKRNLESLREISFPPGLGAVYHIDVVDACMTCAPRWASLRWIEIELPSRKVTVRTERKHL